MASESEMATAPQLDLNAALDSFLLRAYIDGFSDPYRGPDDAAKARLELEAFVLRHGPTMLRYVQRALDITAADPANDSRIADWFLTFVGSLGEDWLRAVNLGTLERFWRDVQESRIARAVIDTIAKVECINDPFGNAAAGSLIGGLFREAQPQPLPPPLTPRASTIFQTLIWRISLTAAPQPKRDRGLPHYAARVLRYCFKPENEHLNERELDEVVTLAGEVTDAVRQLLYSELAR